MPELPEVETIRIGLEQTIAGSTISDVRVFDFPGVIDGLSAAQFNDAVAGQSFSGFRRRGKYLLFDLSNDLTVMVHLRMTGQLLVELPESPATRFEHLRFNLDDGKQLRFADQRKFGRVSLFTPADVQALDRKLGIEPLDGAFTARWLEDALENRTGMIKALLLDQSFIAGIGNIYADEALYRAKIHPQLPANRLSPGHVRHLHRQVRYVLRNAIDRRGTTFSHYRDSSGGSGSNQFYLEVYGLGRGGRLCHHCGTELMCLKVAGRSSHICPGCQPDPVDSFS